MVRKLNNFGTLKYKERSTDMIFILKTYLDNLIRYPMNNILYYMEFNNDVIYRLNSKKKLLIQAFGSTKFKHHDSFFFKTLQTIE